MKAHKNYFISAFTSLETSSSLTRNAFCGTWYLPHTDVHNERTVLIIARCIANARNGHSTFGLTSDVTIVFLDPDLL